MSSTQMVPLTSLPRAQSQHQHTHLPILLNTQAFYNHHHVSWLSPLGFLASAFAFTSPNSRLPSFMHVWLHKDKCLQACSLTPPAQDWQLTVASLQRSRQKHYHEP